MRGKNNGAGIGLVELCDLDRLPLSRLENISTRGFIDAGDNVLIAALLSAEHKVPLIFARARSQPAGQRLQDPALEVHDAYGDVIASNDNWKIDDHGPIA